MYGRVFLPFKAIKEPERNGFFLNLSIVVTPRTMLQRGDLLAQVEIYTVDPFGTKLLLDHLAVTIIQCFFLLRQ